MIASFVLPILISATIIVIYVQLCNGTSKLFNLTRFGDENYLYYLRLSDTYRLIGIIERVCHDYLDNFDYSEEDCDGNNRFRAENDETGSDASEDDNQGIKERVLSELDEDEKELLHIWEQAESKRNRGRLEKALRLIKTGFPKKKISTREADLYRVFYEQLEKYVKFPEEKSISNYLHEAVMTVLPVCSVVLIIAHIEWTLIPIVVLLACIVITIYLYTKFLYKIYSKRTDKEKNMLYMYGLLEDIVVFKKPIYDTDNLDDYWKAKNYANRMYLKFLLCFFILNFKNIENGGGATRREK